MRPGVRQPPPTIDDGMGEGVFRLPLLGGRFSLLVGAPEATVHGSPQAGLVSVFASEPGQGVVPHPLYHPALIEGAHSSHCIEAEHRFAWEDAPTRAFGRGLSWYSEDLGDGFLVYANDPVVGAPLAASGNGMVAQYRGCLSCGSFASSAGSLALEGDELGTHFGTAIGVGVFELANVASPHLWRQNSSEAQQTAEVPDDDDPADQFGAAVGAIGFNYDKVLVIGVPGEDMGQGAVVVLVLIEDPISQGFTAPDPGTILRPADVGLQDAVAAHWGEIIVPPRAFPTQPVEYPS